MSELMANRTSPLAGFRDILVGLRPGRDVLKARLEARVDAMFASGLVEEVRKLRLAHGAAISAFKAIGYREVLLYLEGEIDLEAARALTLLSTTRYAKRQMTWLRREPDIVWFEGVGEDESVRARVFEHIRQAIPDSREPRDLERSLC